MISVRVRAQRVESIQPGFGVEPLEGVPRIGKRRLGAVGSVLGGEPFGVFELDDDEDGRSTALSERPP